MTERLSVAEFRALQAKPRRSKYRNVQTVYDGRLYASKLEAEHAAELDMQKRAGLIRGWVPQVSMSILNTQRRIVIDFLVVKTDGTFELQDTKGLATKDWQIKRELLEASLGVRVVLIRKGRRNG
jgi:hypothetical protein